MTPATLRAARLAAGLTQAELGRMCGTTQAQISDWEVGRRAIHSEDAALLTRAFQPNPAGRGATLAGSDEGAGPTTLPTGRCAHCGRLVGLRDRRAACRSRLLPPGFCGPCGAPLTDEAKGVAPLDGFIRAANVADRRPAAWSANEGAA